MRASDVLQKARAHLVGGWHPVLSLTAAGKICPASDEGISLFCVDDALEVAAAGDAMALVHAWNELSAQVHHVTGEGNVFVWESDARRTHGDVLQLFARAHKHALTKEQR